MTRLYLDSNVLIAYLLDEIDRAFNPRGQQVAQFFTVCRDTKSIFILSDLFYEEVEKITGLPEEGVNETLTRFGVPFEKINDTPGTKSKEIQRATGIHAADAIHTANAITAKAEKIITWNERDFQKVSHLIPIENPVAFCEDALKPVDPAPRE